ncbi:MAG TPA: amidohydrolase family protein [Chloroflexota bacterium]|nr:amidohydrolase family protein [Chloroflexota bacterium]
MALISVDDHVQEPPDLWTKRLPASLRDRGPRLEGGHWTVDGKPLGGVAHAGAFMADRAQEPRTWDDVPEAAYVPAERLKAMDAAGVDYSVLYPSVAGFAGQAFAGLADPELELACVQAYNDWLLEEWAGADKRFVPQCIVPLWPVEATVAEIRRAVGLGHRGVVYPSVPHELREVPHVAEPDYDPVWAVCEELDVPLCLHAGASPALQNTPPEGLSPAMAEALEAVHKPVSSVYVLNLFLLARILTRHPKLKLVLAESALSWAMLDLEWTDHQFEHDNLRSEGYELTPSELFHRQVYVNSWYDEVAPFVSYVGARNILWSTNLPLATSTWPRTQQTIERCFRGVSASDREAILWGNAAALYGIA